MTVCHNQGRLHGAPPSHRDTAGASSHLPRLSLARLLTTTDLFVIIRLGGDNWQTLGYITHSTTLGFKKYHYQWDRSQGDGGGDISYQICPRHISSCCGQLIIVGRSQALSLSPCFPLSPITAAAAQVRNISDIVARHSCPAIPPSLTEMKHFLSRIILSC